MAAPKPPQPDPPDQPPCTMASLLRPIPIDPENAEQAEVIQKVLFILQYGGLRHEHLDPRKSFLQTLDRYCRMVEQDLFVLHMRCLMNEEGGKP
jgi:hypothetical protein